MNIHKTGTPEINMSMISQFNGINKCGYKVSNQGDVDYDKQIESANNPYKKKRKQELLGMKSIVVV